MRTSNYVRYLGLQHEPGMQYDAHECFLKLRTKILLSIYDNCMFQINKLEATFVMIVVTLQKLSCMLWLFSAFRGFKQCSNYKWDVTSAFGSKERILKKLQIYWWMLRVEYINKSCLHDAII